MSKDATIIFLLAIITALLVWPHIEDKQAPAAPIIPAVEAAPKAVPPEVFELRSKCDALSRKLMGEQIAEAVEDEASRKRLGQDYTDYADLGFTQKSHYDPATGHCYAQIEQSSQPRDGKGKYKKEGGNRRVG